MTIAAIVLAAGRGTRFAPGPKMLAPLDGKPLVRHAAEAAIAGSASPVLVVVGYEATRITAALAGLDVQIVLNPSYDNGLSTSLRAGFAALPAETDGAVILLGDMPLVAPQLITRLIGAWIEAGRPPALVPFHNGRRGNPAVLSRTLSGEIERLTGDIGAGKLLHDRAGVVEWALDDEAVANDVDTEAALRAIGERRGADPIKMAT